MSGNDGQLSHVPTVKYEYGSALEWYQEGRARVEEGHSITSEDMPKQLLIGFRDTTDNTLHCVSMRTMKTTCSDLAPEIREALKYAEGRAKLFQL